MQRQPEPFLFEKGPQVVVLLHAFAGSSNDVRMLGRCLQRNGYTVCGPIFTGHATGEPKDILTQGSPTQWLQDARNAVDQLRQAGHEQIAVFGLSLGGIFATRLLEEDSKLAGGGVFSSPVVSDHDTNVPKMFPKMAAHTYRDQHFDQDQVDQSVKWIKQRLPIQLGKINQFSSRVRRELSQISKPFFIAQGGQDEMISSQSGARLEKLLTSYGKKVDYHFYENASHVLTVNSAHHQLETDVLKYLTTIF